MKNAFTFIFALISLFLYGEIKKGCIASFSIMRNLSDNCKYTAKDYVQNGLVCIFDGKENVGWNKFNPSLLQMFDLMDDSQARYFNYEVLDKYWFYNSKWRRCFINDISISAEEYTFEICVKKPESLAVNVRYIPILSIASSEAQCISFRPSNGRARMNIMTRDGEATTNFYVDWENLIHGYTVTYSISDHIAYGYFNGTYCGSVGNRNLDGRIIREIRLNADSSSTSFSPVWVGCIRLYSRKLSNEEIALNAKIDKERFELP